MRGVGNTRKYTDVRYVLHTIYTANVCRDLQGLCGEIRVRGFQIYGDCMYTCNPCNFWSKSKKSVDFLYIFCPFVLTAAPIFWLQCLLNYFDMQMVTWKNSGGAPRVLAPKPLNWIRQVQRLVAVIWIWSRYGSYYIVSVNMGLKMRLQTLKQNKSLLIVCLRS